MEYGYFDAFLKSLYINFSILGFRKFITWKNEICSITKAILIKGKIILKFPSF